jgi:hypothetical protein
MSNINEERFSAKAIALYCHIGPRTVYNRASRLKIRTDRCGFTVEQVRMINEYCKMRGRPRKFSEDEIRQQHQRLTELLK